MHAHLRTTPADGVWRGGAGAMKTLTSPHRRPQSPADAGTRSWERLGGEILEAYLTAGRHSPPTPTPQGGWPWGPERRKTGLSPRPRPQSALSLLSSPARRSLRHHRAVGRPGRRARATPESPDSRHPMGAGHCHRPSGCWVPGQWGSCLLNPQRSGPAPDQGSTQACKHRKPRLPWPLQEAH